METDTKGNTGQIALSWLAHLKVGDGVFSDRVVVFPAFAGNGADRAALDYRTLGEAIAAGWVEVTERAAATVPELVLRNWGKSMVLVLDGEEIVGGRQNRIVNASFLVAAGSEVVIPVTCVEHGRWRDVSPRFAPGEASFFSLKREKHEQVTANLRASGRMAADQSAVWASLAERQAEAGVHSDTGAMNDLYRSRESSLHEYERALGYVKGAVGMVVAINGRMAGAEVFDQPGTAEALWAKLVRSYTLDALDGERGAPVAHSRAVRFLERARDAGCEVYPSLA